MTRYTVVWVRSAQDDLANLWLNAPDRNAVTTATHAIDQALGENAPSKGSDLREGLRSLFVPPLRAIFTVREDDRIAEVLRVRSV
jgi:plasmid stabilization system protein ParE